MRSKIRIVGFVMGILFCTSVTPSAGQSAALPYTYPQMVKFPDMAAPDMGEVRIRVEARGDSLSGTFQVIYAGHDTTALSLHGRESGQVAVLRGGRVQATSGTGEQMDFYTTYTIDTSGPEVLITIQRFLESDDSLASTTTVKAKKVSS